MTTQKFPAPRERASSSTGTSDTSDVEDEWALVFSKATLTCSSMPCMVVGRVMKESIEDKLYKFVFELVVVGIKDARSDIELG